MVVRREVVGETGAGGGGDGWEETWRRQSRARVYRVSLLLLLLLLFARPNCNCLDEDEHDCLPAAGASGIEVDWKADIRLFRREGELGMKGK